MINVTMIMVTRVAYTVCGANGKQQRAVFNGCSTTDCY